MSRAFNGIATEKDIEWGIDNGLFIYTLVPSEYTNRAITKGRLSNYINYDETLLTGLADNQLVKWDLIKTSFTTNFPNGIKFSRFGGTFNYKISSQYGWSSTKSSSWITSLSPSTGSSGVKDFSFTLSQKSNVGDRTGTITFTETISNKEIILTITQRGTEAPNYASILLRRNILESNACSTDPMEVFYFIEYGQSLFTTSGLWSDNNGVNYAPAGYYTDGLIWRQWTGSSWNVSGFCGL